MSIFSAIGDFLTGLTNPPEVQEDVMRPTYADNVGGPMAQNLRTSMIGRMEPDISPAERTTPTRPTGGDSLYDRRRAASIIRQLEEQGVAPESAAAIAAAQLDQAPGGVTVYDPFRSGVFGNYQMRFDSMSNLRSFAERLGGDINDLSSLLSYRENEGVVAELAGYELTGGEPGLATERLGSLHSEFGQFLLNRPNQRAAILADKIYSDFYGNQAVEEAEEQSEPLPQEVPPVASSGAEPAPDTRGPGQVRTERAAPPIERPGDFAIEMQQNPIGLYNQDGEFVAFRSMSRKIHQKIDALKAFLIVCSTAESVWTQKKHVCAAATSSECLGKVSTT